MPTRTIKLKMLTRSANSSSELRKALWTTHEQINLAVAEVERILLLCRGASYWICDLEGSPVLVSESEVKQQAIEMARGAQRENNNGKIIGTDDEILVALRRIYEAIVPSCRLDDSGVPLKGDAQSAGNNFSGPLLDLNTCSGKGPFSDLASKILPEIPSWAREIQKECFDKNNSEIFRSNKGRYFEINTKQAGESFANVIEYKWRWRSL